MLIFQALDKIKRQTIMSAVMLMALGSFLLICPQEYVDAVVTVAGYILIIVSTVMILDYLDGPRALINHIYLTAALVFGIIGVVVLVFSDDVLNTFGWLFGLLLIGSGAYGVVHAFLFARRSQRRGWSVLVFLSGTLLALGILIIAGVIFLRAWLDDSPVLLLRICGGTILFSAVVSALRLIWIWPFKNKKGDESDGKR